MKDKRLDNVIFTEETHTYFYRGKRLSGITGSIGKLLDKTFPDNDTVKLATIYGKDIHKEIENYINSNTMPSTVSGKWIVNYLKEFFNKEEVIRYESEVLVSNFTNTASSIDIVAYHRDNSVSLFDIKTTSKFDRLYCSLQLSCYKRLFEDCFNIPVKAMYVLGTKSQRAFKILEQEKSKVDKIFQLNEKTCLIALD